MSEMKTGLVRAGVLLKGAEAPGELEKINRQTLRPLTAEEVFTFRLAACDDQVDRDLEQFDPQALEDMAKLFPGRPVLMDHRWSAEAQTARIYDAAVEARPGGGVRLVLSCYIPRIEQSHGVIEAIETGILRECSVGLQVGEMTCSVCKQSYFSDRCLHIKGREYGGQVCHVVLSQVEDVYEVSMVGVPAQREAGVVKGAEAPGQEKDEERRKLLLLAQAEQRLEEIRFGGI